jgi:phospho-N-acetylmuramoyl-pentapeptide-transferase
MIVGIVNAVNLTDGIDGLNASVTFFTGLFLMIISNISGVVGIDILSACLLGGCCGFLIYNFHPAKVFMGDTGSLFLGGMVCALGFGTNLHVVLVLISFVYILEMLSVILQVLYFKYTHGKRLFKMSPIHHHFEMIGWSETKICTVFSLAMIFFGIISFILSIYAF